MPMATVELPQDVVMNAKRYAESTHCDFANMVAFALKKVYGIDSVYVVSEVPRKRKTYGELTDELTGGVLSPSVKALMGVVGGHSEAAEKSYDDLKWEYFKEKAVNNRANVIVTRDKTGFVSAKIPVLTPTEFLDREIDDTET